jgi:hypothetical protein
VKVILDESHYIKQRKSQRSLLLAGLMQQATRLLLLSGTPALARPVELYPQVFFLFLRGFLSLSRMHR